jgi:hypothetical protein
VAADFGRELPESGQLKGILADLCQNWLLAFRYVKKDRQPTGMYGIFPESQGSTEIRFPA